jgi:hypothetical protein
MPQPEHATFPRLNLESGDEENIHVVPTVTVIRQRRYSFLTMSKTALLGKQLKAFHLDLP